MKKRLFFLPFCFLTIPITVFSTTTIQNLRVEYLKNPIGIDVQNPRFSWEMESDEIGRKQTAYEITVSDLLGSVVWSSGQINSDLSVGIKYDGPALSASTRYFWNVKVQDNANSSISSSENAFFEMGLMNSGWSGANWLKVKERESAVDESYASINITTLELDFEIANVAAGVCFGASKNKNMYFLWQINIGRGRSLLRPHYYSNNIYTLLAEIDFTDKIKIEKGKSYRLRIEKIYSVEKGYSEIVTSINNIEINRQNYSRMPDLLNNFGFRQYKNDLDDSYEEAYYDNIKGFYMQSLVYEEDFSDTSKLTFTNGTIVNGRFHVGGNQDTNSWQIGNLINPVSFTLSFDLTLLNHNIAVFFGAKNADVDNRHFWSINTYFYGNEFPNLDRRIYDNVSHYSSRMCFNDKFTSAQLLNTEHRVKIDVAKNHISTYIDGVLIDTYFSPELKEGYFGFAAYTGGYIREHALIDNIEYIYYEKDANGNKVQKVYTENFENGSNDFEGSTTVVVNGNTKMEILSKTNREQNVYQSSAYGIPQFRSEFSLTKEIKSARIYSSALGVYDLFVNGDRVGAKQADGKIAFDEFKPGWTDYRKTVFYTTYDITDLLKVGQNAVGSQVSSGWFNGDIAHGEYGNPELGFLAKIVVEYTDGSQEIMVTNPDTWKASTNSAIRMADIYQGERYDARKESNWTSAGYEDWAWKQAVSHDYFKGDILSFIGQPVRVRPELVQLPQTTTIYQGTNPTGSNYGEINIVTTISGNTGFSLKKGETAVIDFGQNFVGWVKFRIKGSSGATLTGRFAEMLNDSGDESRGNDNAKGTLYLRNLRSAKATMKYTLKGDVNGETYHPSMTFFGFRYCELSATDDITIESLSGEVVGNINEENSTFSTNNSLVNKLYSNVIWGMRGNFLSVPTDCPQRDERLGWMGDTQIFSRAATYNADVASFFHKWAKDVIDSQQPDGTYPSVVPDNWNVGYGRTAWAEAGIIVPWNIYLMYGDKGILESNYSSMERFMNWLATQQINGFIYIGGNTQYGDWLAYQNTDPRYISVCYYAYAAQLMTKISKALSQTTGDTFDQNAVKYQTLYDNIKVEFQKRYTLRSGLPAYYTQTSYLLALRIGLLTPDKIKQSSDELVKMIQANGNKLSTGFVGTGILNQTLSEFGASETAYNLLLQRNDPSWLYSVDQGATTIWERWNSYTITKGFGDPGMNSFNHYSYGAVSEWMFRYMAGIETDENNPGFKHFILQSNPDLRDVPVNEKITRVDASYGSYYGKIKSKWERSSNGNYRYSVTVPANTTATLYILKLKETSQITQKGIAAELVPGVKSIVDEGTRFVLELESGSYVFEDGLFETSVTKPKAESEILKIYPNPVSKGSHLYVETSMDLTKKDTTLKLYSIIGNHIADYKISQKNTVIAMNQNPGAYFMELISGENLMEKMKVIVK